MKIKELFKENASAGASSAGGIASISAPLGSAPGFGGDATASIYSQIKKHRTRRKKKVSENISVSKSWQVSLDLFKQFSNAISRLDKTNPEKEKFVYDIAKTQGCSDDEAWEVVENFFKKLRKWGPTAPPLNEEHWVDAIYPDSIQGVQQALKTIANTDIIQHFDRAHWIPDPQVEGVWQGTAEDGARIIVYQAGYCDPWGNIRKDNDFETTWEGAEI